MYGAMPTLIDPIEPDGRTLAKGSIVRGWVEALITGGLMRAVIARSVPEVATLLRDPPASTAWVDVAYLECISEAVRLEVGDEQVLDLSLRAHRVGLVALLSRWLGGIVRVFGPSPHTVLKHGESAARANTVGMTMSWTKLGDKHGELGAYYPYRNHIYLGAAWAVGAACLIVGETVGARMTLKPPRITKPQAGGSLITIPCSWD
jgi:hypothetical protein